MAGSAANRSPAQTNSTKLATPANAPAPSAATAVPFATMARPVPPASAAPTPWCFGMVPAWTAATLAKLWSGLAPTASSANSQDLVTEAGILTEASPPRRLHVLSSLLFERGLAAASDGSMQYPGGCHLRTCFEANSYTCIVAAADKPLIFLHQQVF